VRPLYEQALRLPRPIEHRLEAGLLALLQPPGRAPEDFASPAGEPALLAAGSVSWQLFKNPVTTLIGGIAGVVLELAEPGVRAGVWEHTYFRERPLERLQRTGLAAMMSVYGPRSHAEAMIARVVGLHAHVKGRLPDGRPYSAGDPDRLVWVHATASFGFIEAWAAYVRPLDDAERDRFHAEGAPIAQRYGALEAPSTQAELVALFERMREQLEPSPVLLEFLRIMQTAPLLPRAARPLQRWLVQAAVELVPPALRARLGLGPAWRLGPLPRRVVRRLAGLADRVLLPAAPHVQACRRLGLVDDWLYR
jgi:uncharacterized protein (DUF2236 family)